MGSIANMVVGGIMSTGYESRGQVFNTGLDQRPVPLIRRPSVLPVGATQHQLLLRESVSHYVLLYQDFAPSKDFLFHNSAEETD